MTTNAVGGGETADAAKSVSIPILVGVVGKRKDRLVSLGVSEDSVRQKLQAAFDLLETLTPSSPKLLLCGVADGVDEIAARLVVGPAGGAKRRYPGWTVAGLLPLPEDVFAQDFSGDAAPWYRALDESQRRLIRMMPLRTLTKPGTKAAYTADELRRIAGQSNHARTLHYEQLALVLAARATVFIAVMPDDELPNLPGGTAQAVAHRVNGWRPDWPPPESAAVAEASEEFVVPSPLVRGACGDAWLIPISADDSDVLRPDLFVLRRREEAEQPWPPPVVERQHRHSSAAENILIAGGKTFAKNAFVRASVAKAIDGCNRRALDVENRKAPAWDRTIREHPDDPRQWSPAAVAEQVRGTLSDIQVRGKRNVRFAAGILGLLAWASILCLEIYLELNKSTANSNLHPLIDPKYLLVTLPIAYACFVGWILAILQIANWRGWSAIAEDYRMVAEALRVQIAWWQFGLTARRDWVDQHILRYDVRELHLVRQGFAALLDAIALGHAALPEVDRRERLPEFVDDWVGAMQPKPTGQVGYQARTAHGRKHVHEKLDTTVWWLFGVSFSIAICLALHALHEGMRMHILDDLAKDIPATFLVPLIAAAWVLAGVLYLRAMMETHYERAADIVTPHRIFHSALPGLLLGVVLLVAWYHWEWDREGLNQVLGLSVLVSLATAGTIKYIIEKLDLEAEAQNAAEASIIYMRARRTLDSIDRGVMAKTIDLPEANRQRECVIRDLGLYALAETESWLRSHRERPLHPPVGS